MPAKKKSSKSVWVDPEDAPDLSTPYWQEKIAAAPLMRGDKVIRPGRPTSENPKIRTTIRLSPEVVSHFKATGRGWQSRIDKVLVDAIKRRA